jgi:hypothetical protein
MNNEAERFSLYRFSDLDHLPFDAVAYSRLKFGSALMAHHWGSQLAQMFWDAQGPAFFEAPLVVIPSPYVEVPNAAEALGRAFAKGLTVKGVPKGYPPVRQSHVARTAHHVVDYGRLSRTLRETALSRDTLDVNAAFLKGKAVVCIDDVRMTGSHEASLRAALAHAGISVRAWVYVAIAEPGVPGETEDALNHAGVAGVDTVVQWMQEPGHRLQVRPLKYLLGLPAATLREKVLPFLREDQIQAMYTGALSDGLACVPSYGRSLALLSSLCAPEHGALSFGEPS